MAWSSRSARPGYAGRTGTPGRGTIRSRCRISRGTNWRGASRRPGRALPGGGPGAGGGPGRGVPGWRAGDRVTVPFACGCGVCAYCRAGDAQVCPWQTQPGFTGPGSFAERVAIQAADVNLVALPDSVSFVTAACLGCRFATAFRALTVHGRLGAGDWLAVHGCGGVGLSAVMIASALGARVVAVDVASAALDRARDLGAEAAVDAARDPDPAATLRDIKMGGAQVSIDALGTPATGGLACSAAPCPPRRFRWTWSSRGNGRSTARTAWPPANPRRCWPWSR